MFIRLNNYLLGAFLALGILDVLINRRLPVLRENLLRSWPVLVFFLLALLACLRTFGWESLTLLERYWSFLLLPIVLFSRPALFSEKRREVFLALTYGCIATLLICYGNLIWNMYQNGDTIRQLYQPDYVGQAFTAIADSHPPYLGLFILTAIVFLINDRVLSKKDIFLHVVFLILGLFQLASRMAILLLLILFVFLLLWFIRQYSWQILVLFSGILLIGVVFMNYGSNYMADRFFRPQAYTIESRLQRWEVSYDIFRENPLLGVGYQKVRDMRAQMYRDRNLPFGQEGDYNAHNQFLEYLSTNGAIGGFVYVVSLMYLLLFSLARRDLVFVFVFASFLIANMSESNMVRIKGIEYFAIFATVFLIGTVFGKEQPEVLAAGNPGV